MREPDAGPENADAHRIFACARCSRRKQRCDKVLPTCGQCSEAGSQCLGSDRESSVVQLSAHQVARKGYVTSLQERITILEDRLRSNGVWVTDETPSADNRNKGHHNERSNFSRHSPFAPHQDNLPLQRADVDMSSLALSTMAEPRNRTGEFLKHLSMSRIIAGVTETYGGDPEKTTRIDSLWDGISKYIRHPTSQAHRLYIQRAEALKALDAYLVTVDFRFPRLPVDKVRSGIEAITASEDVVYRQMYAKYPAHVFMAYMVVAIVPLVSDNYPISQGSFVSIHVLAKCMRVLDRVFVQEDGIDIIQCLHLLVIFSIHCSAAGSAWHLIGLAISKCIALGYHRESASAVQTHPIEKQLEQRRWVFWGCYLLDRLVCVALGRPYSIDDRYITVSLPGTSGSESPLSREDAYHVHLFQYAQLLSKAGNITLHQNFDDSLSDLLHWRASSPPPDTEAVKQALLHQTSLYHTLILRFAINDIISAYSSRAEMDLDTLSYIEQQGDQEGDGNLRHVIERESRRIHHIKLLYICHAVAKSLDRRHMAGRHYLSLTTGYSAFSMALATIYWLVITSISTETLSIQSDSEHAKGNDVLNIASRKLDVVGRQFPRLHEYRNTVDQLRRLSYELRTMENQGLDPQDWKDVNESVAKIGPMHLKLLGLAILFLVRRSLEGPSTTAANAFYG